MLRFEFGNPLRISYSSSVRLIYHLFGGHLSLDRLLVTYLGRTKNCLSAAEMIIWTKIQVLCLDAGLKRALPCTLLTHLSKYPITGINADISANGRGCCLNKPPTIIDDMLLLQKAFSGQLTANTHNKRKEATT